MITKVVTKAKTFHNDQWWYRAEYYGVSTDTKPTKGVKNADIFYEMDTQSVYMFDADASTWLKQ